MPTYYIRHEDRQELRHMRAAKGEVRPLSVDFSAWAEDGGALTSATWTVKSGNAAISSEALASNVASAVVTTAESGSSLIEVKGIGATHTKIFSLRVVAKDLQQPVYDYDFGGVLW